MKNTNTANNQATSQPKPDPQSSIAPWEKIVAVVFGITFVIVLLVMTVIIPDPTATQYRTFTTIMALAAAGIGGILAGTIHVEGRVQQWTIRAGGAIALFVLTYFFSPAPPAQWFAPEAQSMQTIEKGGTGYQHTGSGHMNIGNE